MKCKPKWLLFFQFPMIVPLDGIDEGLHRILDVFQSYQRLKLTDWSQSFGAKPANGGSEKRGTSTSVSTLIYVRGSLFDWKKPGPFYLL
jgi:hypothetical protein